jgi:hypothetical protein
MVAYRTAKTIGEIFFRDASLAAPAAGVDEGGIRATVEAAPGGEHPVDVSAGRSVAEVDFFESSSM